MCSTFTHLKRFSRRALDSEKSRLQNFRKTPNSLKSICITARLIASTRDELSPLKVKWRKQQVLKIIHKLKRSGQSNLPFIAYFLPIRPSIPASTPLSNYGSPHHRLHNSVSPSLLFLSFCHCFVPPMLLARSLFRFC